MNRIEEITSRRIIPYPVNPVHPCSSSYVLAPYEKDTGGCLPREEDSYGAKHLHMRLSIDISLLWSVPEVWIFKPMQCATACIQRESASPGLACERNTGEPT